MCIKVGWWNNSTQNLFPRDKLSRVEFGNVILGIINDDDDALKLALMSEEAYFHVTGFREQTKYTLLGNSESYRIAWTTTAFAWCDSMVWSKNFLGWVEHFSLKIDNGESIRIDAER